jgi:hypothetical protein
MEEKNENEKDAYYDMLERTYENCPSNDVKIICGYFNAKIGQDESARPTTGMNSLHKDSNDNGMRLINCAASLDTTIGSTIFPHTNIQKITWRSPDGKTMNQIDHVLIDSRHCNNLLDVRSYRGANMDSDHFLVIAKIESRINTKYNKQKETGSQMYDITKLKNSEVIKQYKDKLTIQLQNTEVANEIDNGNWAVSKRIITEVANEVIPKENRIKKN